MEIVITFQGDEFFNISLPNNVKSVEFDLDVNQSEPYSSIYFKIPTIKKVEFHDKAS